MYRINIHRPYPSPMVSFHRPAKTPRAATGRAWNHPIHSAGVPRRRAWNDWRGSAPSNGMRKAMTPKWWMGWFMVGFIKWHGIWKHDFICFKSRHMKGPVKKRRSACQSAPSYFLGNGPFDIWNMIFHDFPASATLLRLFGFGVYSLPSSSIASA